MTRKPHPKHQSPDTAKGFFVPKGQPLIVIPVDGGTLYFTSHEDADAYVNEERTLKALAVAGAWSDMDWEEMERELWRIRHESPPSPPLEL